MQPIYTLGEGDILQLDGKIFGVVANYKSNEDGEYTQIIILYPENDKALNVFKNLNANLDPYLKVIKKNSKGFVFEDYQKKYGKISLIDSKILIMIHLINKPSI